MKNLELKQMENYQATGYGQDLADCISDAYTNHGWASVITWATTLYNPAFGAGIAAGCAIAVY